VFSAVLCNLVRAGEATGRLPEVLKNLADSLKWEDELASHTRKLVTYPVLVGTVVLAVTVFLMVYLVPQMAAFIRNMGQALPLQTRILIAVSYAFTHYWYLILGVPLAAAIAAGVAIQIHPQARLHWDAFKLRLPLIGPIYRKIILSRFSSVFAMMYASGIAVIEAVRTTEDVVGNMVIREGAAARRTAHFRRAERHPRRSRASACFRPWCCAHAARRREHGRPRYRAGKRELFLQPRRQGVGGAAAGRDRTGADLCPRHASAVGHDVGAGGRSTMSSPA